MVTLATMVPLTAPALGATTKQEKVSRPAEVTAPRDFGEPIMAIVSIKSQQVTLYDADGWIYRAPVSTGTKGRETPAGIFAVLEKEKEHYSTMYDDASMPHMQRITWNGIALHGGPLPGYAASHGCIRMPFGFAERLFDKTRIGMRVIISPDDAEPVEFSDPALLQPKQEALAAAPAKAEALVREAADAAKLADEAKKAAAKAPHEIKLLNAALRKIESLKKNADAELASAEKALTAVNEAKAKAEDAKPKAAIRAADLAMELDVAKTDAKPKLDELAATKAAAGKDREGKKIAATAAKEEASLLASLKKLEAQKKNADANVVTADKAFANAEQAKVRAEERKGKATAKAADLTKQFDAAKAETQPKLDALAATKDAAKAAEKKKVETAKAATDAKLAVEPVSIYISRATKKLYVRRNTHKPAPDGGGVVYDTSIEVPVTIKNPDKRLGTHVFTAMATSGAGLRWSAVSIEKEDGAKSALDRITIPQEVIDRIGPTVLPRSSIVISDEPLSKETNYRTEFVAVLNDQPQGGFITRKPTPKDPVQDYRGGFFGFLFGPPPADNSRSRGRYSRQGQREGW
jgi:hypothetical protein